MTWVCSQCGGENPEGMRFCGHCGSPATAAPVARPPAPAPETSGRDVAEALRSFVAGPVADQLVEAGGRLPEERRLITALFADVSGFTSLADRLDPEELLEVIDPVISGLSSIVGRYEGYVEKFAGDALLALFGAPVSHEDDAERAIRVALEMHRELARLCDGLPHKPELTLHVGINSGHGIARILGSEARMDYAVLGDSVILAQRLESSAPPGETYVSESTVRLTRERFEFESVGELTLKGKAEPVPAWRLIGERQAVARRETPIVGREPELATLTTVLETLAGGRGGAVRITGEPGVGKSKLTEEAERRARERGVRWLQTRCLSYGAALAYWPYTELVRRIAGIRAEHDPDEAGRRLAAALALSPESISYVSRLLGLPGPGGEHLEPEAFRRALHHAFASWLRALAVVQPLVLALDDMHWADPSTLALTAELTTLCDGAPFALYLIARPEGADTLAEIAPDAAALELGPLDETGVQRLIEHALDGPAPAGMAAMVLERGAGNPFFVEELVRSLQETEALSRADGGWRMRTGWDEAEVPPTIEGVLSSRIDLLPRSAAAVLQTASVIGRQVRVPLLRAVSGALPVDDSVPQLVASGFLEPLGTANEETLVFHHALVQEVAYSRLLRRRRQELHRSVAEHAEALYGASDDVVDLLARHLYLGEAGAKAAAYLIRAGERAKRLFANDEAIEHFTRAARVSRSDPEAASQFAEVLLELADLRELVGDYDGAHADYEEVRKATSDVRAWRGIASTLRKRGRYGDALAIVDRAFAAEELRGADLGSLWLEQGWTLSLAGRFDQAIDVLQAGLEADRARDGVAGSLLLQLARAETVEGRLEPALEHGLEAIDIFEEHDDLRGLATSMRILGGTYNRLERLDEAAAALRRGLALAERVGSVEEIGGCLINLGLTELRRGALDEAIACDRRAIEEFERVGHGSGRANAYANLAEKLVHTGEYAEAQRLCDRALELAREIGHTYTVADTLQTQATLSAKQGDTRGAANWAEEAAGLFLEMGASPQAVEALRLAADSWNLAGETDRARAAETRARSLRP